MRRMKIEMVREMYKCPVCDDKLVKKDKQLICSKGHSFDLAKKGYVNLLLANQRNAKMPGDSKEMVEARRDFLNKGYYSGMAQKISEIVKEIALEDNNNVLDIGCGEGYFTAHLAGYLRDNDIEHHVYGIDISKPAIHAAASRDKSIGFVVGSNYHLPFLDEAFQMVMWLFAPAKIEEIERVLASGGYLLTANPGPDHLLGLKELLYQDVYLNEEREYELPGFDFIKEETVSDVIELHSSKEINDLLQMTPYYWHISKEASQKAAQAEYLQTKIEFKIRLYKKK